MAASEEEAQNGRDRDQQHESAAALTAIKEEQAAKEAQELRVRALEATVARQQQAEAMF